MLQIHFPSVHTMGPSRILSPEECHGSFCHLSADICLPSSGNNENVVPSWLFFGVIYYRRTKCVIDRGKDRSTSDFFGPCHLFTISLLNESEMQFGNPRRKCLYTSYFHYSWGEVRMSPLGTPATIGPVVPAPDDRWLWSSWWNENWQGKPKYSEKTTLSSTSSATNSTWPYPDRHCGMPVTKPPELWHGL
jgi:hypothetical protein